MLSVRHTHMTIPAGINLIEIAILPAAQDSEPALCLASSPSSLVDAPFVSFLSCLTAQALLSGLRELRVCHGARVITSCDFCAVRSGMPLVPWLMTAEMTAGMVLKCSLEGS